MMNVQDLYSLLRQRIIMHQIDIRNDIQDGVERILNENLVNPKDSNRKVPGFHFIRSNDLRIDSIKISESYFGESLLDAFTKLENEYPIIISITPNEEDSYNFSVEYRGGDHVGK